MIRKVKSLLLIYTNNFDNYWIIDQKLCNLVGFKYLSRHKNVEIQPTNWLVEKKLSYLKLINLNNFNIN